MDTATPVDPRATTPTTPTIVSPDLVATAAVVESTSGATAPTSTVILIPMAEWKQCAQRAMRSAIQAFILMVPLGVSSYLRGLGIPDASLVNLYSTGQPIVDAAGYSVLFGLVVFVWNWVEFFLDIDIKAPKWRA